MSRLLLLLLLLALTLVPLRAQSEAPIIDMTSVLNTRFFPSGAILFAEADLVFAPTPPITASVEVLAGDGSVLQSFAFFSEYRFQDQAFGRLQANGHAEWRATASGDYVIQYRINGAAVTRFPFSVRMQSSADPFAPDQSVEFGGPWSRLGYLALRAHGGGHLPDLVFWAGGADLPAGQRRDQTTARLFRGQTEIAHSKLAIGHITEGHYQQSSHALFLPHEPRRAHEAAPLTLTELGGTDGDYLLTVERQSDSVVIRRFAFAVVGGQLQQHPRAALSYQPRSDLLSPRVYRRGGNYAFQPVIWLTTESAP